MTKMTTEWLAIGSIYSVCIQRSDDAWRFHYAVGLFPSGIAHLICLDQSWS